MAELLAEELFPGSRGLAALVQAAVARQRGDPEASVQLLDRAAGEFKATRLVLFEQVARRRAAELSGDAEAVETIDRGLSERGVQNPRRLSAMLAPGFAPRAFSGD
jgi:hypothetical protein